MASNMHKRDGGIRISHLLYAECSMEPVSGGLFLLSHATPLMPRLLVYFRSGDYRTDRSSRSSRNAREPMRASVLQQNFFPVLLPAGARLFKPVEQS